jgi:hypothetical protein
MIKYKYIPLDFGKPKHKGKQVRVRIASPANLAHFGGFGHIGHWKSSPVAVLSGFQNSVTSACAVEARLVCGRDPRVSVADQCLKKAV